MTLGSNNVRPYANASVVSVCTPPPPDASALKQINAGVEEAINRLGNILGRVDSIGQYLFGPLSEVAGNSACPPSPSGVVPSLRENVGTIHNMISVLNERLDRVSLL